MEMRKIQSDSTVGPGTFWGTVNTENVTVYSLMGIAFCLVFVSLNHLTEYAFFTLLVFWTFSNWKGGTLHWIKTPLDLPIALFLIWILVALPWAADPGYSFAEWRKTVAKIFMFYFVVQAIKSQHSTNRIILSILAGVVVVSLLEVGYFFQRGGEIFHLSNRGGFLTGSSQWLSVFVVMGFPVVFFGLRQSHGWYGWSGALCCLGAITLGLLVCNTRAAWVAIGVEMVVLFCLKFFKQGWVALAGGILVIVMVFLTIISLEKTQEIFPASHFNSTSTMQLRINTWTLASQDIQERPLFGLGYGQHSFGKVYPNLGTEFHSHIHNSFISKAVQLGIPGVFFFSWIFLVVLKKSYNLFRKNSEDDVGSVCLVILLMTVGLMVRNLFDDMFMGTVEYLFWLMVGLLFSTNHWMNSLLLKR